MGAIKQQMIREFESNGPDVVRDAEILAEFHADENRSLRQTVDKLAAEMVRLRSEHRAARGDLSILRASHALLKTRLMRRGRNRCSRFDREWICTTHTYSDEDCPA